MDIVENVGGCWLRGSLDVDYDNLYDFSTATAKLALQIQNQHFTVNARDNAYLS